MSDPSCEGVPAGSGPRSGPIFIVGAPRSGTTLLRAMLDRHPEIALADETYFFYYVARRERTFGDLARPANRRRAVRAYLETRRAQRLGLDLEELARILEAEATSYPAFFESLLRHVARTRGKRRFGEKTPQHALEVETLLGWYPACAVLHLVRDPRDVTASLSRMPWGRRHPVAGARLWRDCVRAASRGAGTAGYLLVRYEDLVADTERELRRIVAFLGERYAPEMLEPRGGERADRWWFERAHGALSRDRVAAWRRELSPLQVALVEWVAGPPMEELGYRREGRALRGGEKIGALAAAAAGGLRERLGRLPALWYRWVRPGDLAKEESWVDRRSDRSQARAVPS